MEFVTDKGKGLFPAPREISLDCSCPDWATLCKHLDATLYGVGARLDHQPEMLFTLRRVDPAELVEAAIGRSVTIARSRRARALESDQLSSVFGVDLIDDPNAAPTPKKTTSGTRGKIRNKRAARKTSPKTRSGSGEKRTAKKAGAKRVATKKAAVKKKAAKKAHRKNAGRKKTAAKQRARRIPV